MPAHVFAFVRHEDPAALAAAIHEINGSRGQRLSYDTLILSAPRRAWAALLLGTGLTDHLLLRNLSGQLDTASFELALDDLAFAYRLHRGGRIIAAFESNPHRYVQQRLEQLQTGVLATDALDLAEPIERWVLRRFQELQRPGTPPQHPFVLSSELLAFYRGQPADLRGLLRSGVDPAYVEQLLAPGYNPEVAFARLLGLLALPYLPNDAVTVQDANGVVIAQVDGYAITRPQTWDDLPLPRGWQRLPALPAR